MELHTDNEVQRTTSRGLQVVLFVIIAFTLVGFFVGIDQGAPDSIEQNYTMHNESIHSTGVAIPATTYREMKNAKTSPNAQWKSDFALIARANTQLYEEFTPNKQDRLLSWLARSEGRAYHGAPPVIPHATDSASNNNCMACHADSVRIGNSKASSLPHPYLASCQQCHAPSYNEGFSTGFVPPTNSFKGAEAPLTGEIAWEGAPPVIPHSTLMRSNCLACHGPNGDQGLRTPHPWQTSCMQCHAPSAELDQRPHPTNPELISSMISSLKEIETSTE